MCRGCQSVHYGIGQGRVVQRSVPSLHWQLGGDDRRASPVTVLQYVQQGQAGIRVDGLQAEVVEDDQGLVGQDLGPAQVGPLELGLDHIVHEPVHSEVHGPMAQQACRPSQCAGEEAFTDLM